MRRRDLLAGAAAVAGSTHRSRPTVEPHPRTSTSASGSPLISVGGMSAAIAAIFVGAQVHHALVVVGGVVDVARAVGLLEPADAVHQARRTRDGPGSGKRGLVTQVRPEHLVALVVDVVRLGGEGHGDVGQRVDRGEVPRLGAVRQVAVGEQDHRGSVLEGDADRLDGGVEALCRRVGGDDRKWGLAVTAVERDVEVGRLGLGRQAGRGAATLDVDQEEREFDRHGERRRLALQCDTRAAGGGHAEVAGERSAQRHADRRDLVLGLHGADAEVLVLRQFVEDVGCRRDRVRAERDRQLRELPGSDDSPGEGRVAGDAGVLAGRQPGRLDLVAVADRLGRLAEVEPREERRLVRRLDQLVAAELLGDPAERGVDRTGVHERHQAEREEVLRAFGVTRLDPERCADLLGERGHRHPQHAVVREGVVVERVRLVARLLEVAFLEGVLVDDDRPAGFQPVQIGHQRGGVHRNEHVRFVAGRGDLVVGDVDLECRDAVDRAGRSPDLGGEVGQRRQVVAERRAHRGEAVTGELHPVAGVAREADDQVVEDVVVVGRWPIDRVRHVVSPGSVSAPAPLPGLWGSTVVAEDARKRDGPTESDHRPAITPGVRPQA